MKHKDTLEKYLEKSPEGSIKIDNRPEGTLFALRTNTDGQNKVKYISKKDTKVLSKYACKRFAKDALNVLNKNLKACDGFLNVHSTLEIEDVAAQYPDEFRKANTLYRDKKAIIDEWRAVEYRSNQYRLDQLVCKASDGNMYRSKAEVMIAEILLKYNLPFRYECEMYLENMKHPIFPDFTILNPKDMSEWYFEHFGMMDSSEYASNAVKKIIAYSNAGYELGNRFVFTVESSMTPLSIEYVERIIRHYFID